MFRVKKRKVAVKEGGEGRGGGGKEMRQTIAQLSLCPPLRTAQVDMHHRLAPVYCLQQVIVLAL